MTYGTNQHQNLFYLLSEAEKLTEAIADKDKINPNYWFSAGYNSPFQLIGRTNEIWLVKK
jgi:hypothetical protein